MTGDGATLAVAPLPLQPARSRQTRRALLFLLVCSPVWVAPGAFSVAHPVVLLAAVLAVTFFFLRRDGSAPAELGLDPTWRRVGELVAGLGGGAMLMVTAAILVRITLPFPWATNPAFDPGMAAFAMLWFLCGNAAEELVFRGYGFQRLIAGVGIWKAQLGTALLFALFHVVNGWPWQVALVGTTMGSLLFGLVFIRWRSVPAAVGVHAAGNWVRDLLLSDPPTRTTLLGPLSPRPWTGAERLGSLAIFTGVTLLACVWLWRSIARRRESALRAG